MPTVNLLGHQFRAEAVDGFKLHVKDKAHADKFQVGRGNVQRYYLTHAPTPSPLMGSRPVGVDAARVAKAEAAVSEGRLEIPPVDEKDVRRHSGESADKHVHAEHAAKGKAGKRALKDADERDPTAVDQHDEIKRTAGTQLPGDAFLGPPSVDPDIRDEVLYHTGHQVPEGYDFDLTVWLRGGQTLQLKGKADQLPDVTRQLDLLVA